MTAAKDRQLGRRALIGTAWSTIERLGSLVLQFVVNLILARLLLPSDFGYIALLAIFMALSRVMIDGGLVSALIQKKDTTDNDFSLIFFWNLALSLLFYGLLYLSAPAIADFYKLPLLCKVIRVYGLSLIFAALSQVQMARLRKNLQFRLIALINLASFAIAGAIAIALAYAGYGVWALVCVEMGYALFMALFYNMLSGWRPMLRVSMGAFRQLFSYGGYLLGANLLQEAAKNIQGMIIGYRFSDFQAGLYSQAHKLDQVNSYALPQALVQVIFPVYSRIQDDRKRLAAMLAQSVRIIAFSIFPLLALLIIVSEPLVVLLWGDVWLPCAAYFRILSVGGMFVSLQNVNFYAVAARGHSRTLFKWSFYKWGLLLTLMGGAMYISIDAIMWALTVSNANIYLVNAWLAHRHVGLDWRKQLLSLLPIVFVTAIASAATIIVNTMLPLETLSPWRIATGCVMFATVYLGLSFCLRLHAVSDMKLIIELIKTKHND